MWVNADNLKAFLFDLNVFEKNLASYKQRGNEVLFNELKKSILK